ncbi:hypothetical protein M514_20207 [Trichuris suis]|uniref:Secreted protein n=1 Tax=Trichuris suis TaxID=68888 RepID=A0A085NDI4_9BILA|nr:hypothetical protein M514_20207 [Trichuris suis]
MTSQCLLPLRQALMLFPLLTFLRKTWFRLTLISFINTGEDISTTVSSCEDNFVVVLIGTCMRAFFFFEKRAVPRLNNSLQFGDPYSPTSASHCVSNKDALFANVHHPLMPLIDA